MAEAQDQVRNDLLVVDVLVVDDRKENLFAIETLLAGPNLAVTAVESGQEALRALLDKEFALVIMDVQMPGMDGYETAELMRANSRTKYIPIIFVSAVSKDEHHLFRGYESGAVDYLFKPVEPKILVSKTKVFVELFRKKRELAKTSEALAMSLERLKERDERLRQTQKLEAIGKLVGGVAHEIRNPLSFIMSHMRRALKKSDQLLKQTATLSAAQQDQFNEGLLAIQQRLQISMDGGERISRIVQDLSRFARTDGNEKKRQVQVNDVLRKVVNLARYDIVSRASLEESYGTLRTIIFNESRLFQVFLNLIMNAIHAIPLNQPSEHKIKISSSMDEYYVRVTISDTGCGISKENLPRIFDPFFTTKAVGEGTGLGLATCYGIVRSHGGAIEVESIVGKGSQFTVLLPFAIN